MSLVGLRRRIDAEGGFVLGGWRRYPQAGVPMRRLIAVLIATLMVSAACTGEAANEDGGEDQGGGRLAVAVSGLGGEVFDPHVAALHHKVFLSLMYDWLVGITPEGEFDNSLGLASHWEFSDDGLTWSAMIREGVTFWDGTPLTVDDVVFSLERVISDEAVSAYSSDLRSVIESVETTGSNEVQVRLNRPYLFLPHLLSRFGATDGAIISKDYFEEVEAEGFASEPMGSGPYELADFSLGSLLRLTAVEDHWRVGTPLYDEITFLTVPEEQTRVAQLQQGDTQIVEVSRQTASELEDSGQTVVSNPDAYTINASYYETWKPGNPFSDPRVREAVSLSINREEIVDSLLLGRAEVKGIGYFTPAHIGWDEAALPPPHGYDPERAEELLEEAGYLTDPVRIDVYQYELPGAPELPEIAQAVAGYLDAVGFKTRTVQEEYGVVRAKWEEATLGPALSLSPTPKRLLYPIELTYGSNGALTVAHDEALDGLLATVKDADTPEATESAIQDLMTYISVNHYGTAIALVDNEFALGEGLTAWEGLDGLLPSELHLEGLYARSPSS